MPVPGDAFVPTADNTLRIVDDVFKEVLRVPVKALRAATADDDTDAEFVATYAGRVVKDGDAIDDIDSIMLACDPVMHAKSVSDAAKRCTDACALCDEREHIDTTNWTTEGDDGAAETVERHHQDWPWHQHQHRHRSLAAPVPRADCARSCFMRRAFHRRAVACWAVSRAA